MIKSILAILVSMVASIAVIYIVESFSNMMYTIPEGLDMNDVQARENWIKNLPFGALLLVLLAWFSGATVGSFIASFLDKERAMRSSVIVGVLLLIATLINLYASPHPIWMWIGGLLAIAAGTWLGHKVYNTHHLSRSGRQES